MTRLDVQCCIAGGGPAGMMLGLLLARAGIRVVVVEKHADFLRDFRGDTIHPSTLELMHELGTLDRFLARPHQEVRKLSGRIADEPIVLADFSQLPTVCKFIALMPQWDFLDFLADEARAYPAFELRMSTEAVDLIHDDPGDTRSRVAGVRARAASGDVEVRAALTVAADGRHSRLREQAGLVVRNFGAPIDVLWMRLPKRATDSVETLGYINAGHVFVTLDRGDYWQCAFVIPKGGYDALRQQGIEALRASIVATVPFMRDRVGELTDWDDIRLLTVLVDRLESWSRDGLLCIGDAAHAMSPIGGVGINLAIQDAVATANLLRDPLRAGRPTVQDLNRVQQRRERPTALTQRLQMIIQDRVLNRTLTSGTASMPLFVRLAQRFPILQRIPARIVGVGFGPEHIR